MSRRTWIVGVSLAAHLALGAGVFVSGAWQIERLDPEKPSLGAIGMIAFSEPVGGSPAATPKVELKKKPKVIAKTMTQIEKRDPTPPKAAEPTEVATIGDGSGNGSGTGSGSGSGSGTGSGSGGCHAPPCPQAAPVPDPPKPPDPKPIIVPTTTLNALFVSGERKIHPSDNTKRQMLRDGKPKAVGIIKTCIGVGGNVTSAVLISSTKYSDYDERLLAAVRSWRYRPHLQQGQPTAACGVVTFIYTIE